MTGQRKVKEGISRQQGRGERGGGRHSRADWTGLAKHKAPFPPDRRHTWDERRQTVEKGSGGGAKSSLSGTEGRGGDGRGCRDDDGDTPGKPRASGEGEAWARDRRDMLGLGRLLQARPMSTLGQAGDQSNTSTLLLSFMRRLGGGGDWASCKADEADSAAGCITPQCVVFQVKPQVSHLAQTSPATDFLFDLAGAAGHLTRRPPGIPASKSLSLCCPPSRLAEPPGGCGGW